MIRKTDEMYRRHLARLRWRLLAAGSAAIAGVLLLVTATALLAGGGENAEPPPADGSVGRADTDADPGESDRPAPRPTPTPTPTIRLEEASVDREVVDSDGSTVVEQATVHIGRAHPEVGWTLDGDEPGLTSVEARADPPAALLVRIGDEEAPIDGAGEVHTRLTAATGRDVEVRLRADGDTTPPERVTVELTIARPR